MDNLHQHEKEVTSQHEQQKTEQKQKLREKKKNLFNNASSQSTFNKYIDFYRTTQLNSDLYRTLQDGLMKAEHPALHNFRERNKEKEKDPLGGIYLKTFQPDKIRSVISQQKIQAQIFHNELYNSELPCNHYEKALRQRKLAKEKSELRFGLGKRTEIENIQDHIETNQIYDYTERDNVMIYFPQWKIDEKEKWTQKNKTFNNYLCMCQGSKSNPPWPQIPIKGQCNDIYVDGFEGLANKQLRQRNQSLEFKRPDFCPVIQNDPWSSTLNISNSIRTYMQDKVLNIDDNQTLYSKNKKLNSNNYKSALLSTKSVDRLVPYKHGQNQYCQTFNNLRPVYPKIFKQSVKQFNDARTPSNLDNIDTGSRTKRTFDQESAQYNQLISDIYPQTTKSIQKRNSQDSNGDDQSSREQQNSTDRVLSQNAIDFRKKDKKQSQIEQITQNLNEAKKKFNQDTLTTRQAEINKQAEFVKQELAKQAEAAKISVWKAQQLFCGDDEHMPALDIRESLKQSKKDTKQNLDQLQNEKDGSPNKSYNILIENQDDTEDTNVTKRHKSLNKIRIKGQFGLKKQQLNLKSNLFDIDDTYWQPLTEKKVHSTVNKYFEKQHKLSELTQKLKKNTQN